MCDLRKVRGKSFKKCVIGIVYCFSEVAGDLLLTKHLSVKLEGIPALELFEYLKQVVFTESFITSYVKYMKGKATPH